MVYYYVLVEIVECNKVMVIMYGLEGFEDFIGKRVDDLYKGEGEVKNWVSILWFFKEDFKIKDFEIYEIVFDGMECWFNNYVVGVFEDNYMVGIWGG